MEIYIKHISGNPAHISFVEKLAQFIGDKGLDIIAIYATIVVAIMIFFADKAAGKKGFMVTFLLNYFLSKRHILAIVVLIVSAFAVDLCPLISVVAYLAGFLYLSKNFYKLVSKNYNISEVDAIKWTSKQGFYTDEFWEYLFSSELYDIDNKDKKYEVGESASYLCKTIFKDYRNHLVEKRHTFSYYPLHKVFEIYFNKDVEAKGGYIYRWHIFQRLIEVFIDLAEQETESNRNTDLLSSMDFLMKKSLSQNYWGGGHEIFEVMSREFNYIPKTLVLGYLFECLYQNLEDTQNQDDRLEMVYAEDLQSFFQKVKEQDVSRFNEIKNKFLLEKLEGTFLSEKYLKYQLKFLEIIDGTDDNVSKVLLRTLWFIKHIILPLNFLEDIKYEELKTVSLLDFKLLVKNKEEILTIMSEYEKERIVEVFKNYSELPVIKVGDPDELIQQHKKAVRAKKIVDEIYNSLFI